MASADRFKKLRAVSDQVMMELRQNGRRVPVRSYLSELLDIGNGAGRRVSNYLRAHGVLPKPNRSTAA